ncbi:MAG TPA: ADP-glyceromanno-heptose 6-epimerase [Bdellovibrionota bacterium]|nr:ADP-glyceromanno-heptose 6-epimerase [Bdellovibrionota bacterium]
MADSRKNAPLLVTGAAGFVGARFSEACLAAGRSVIAVDRLEHFGERPELASLRLRFEATVDREKLWDWLANEKPRLSGIVHLGACTDTQQMDEAFLTRVNLEYSKKIWDHATAEGIPLVYASSGATYGDGSRGYDDAEALIPSLRPLNPYGESKQRFDLWALDRERAGSRPPSWCGFKFFNVYGFGERHKGRMASMVLHSFDQFRKSGAVSLFKSHRPDYENGKQRRDFIYVGDVVDALRFALDRPIDRGIYNLGTGRARTFLDLVAATADAMKVPGQVKFIDMPVEMRERYQYFTEARMDRLRAQGFDRAFLSLEEGVRRTVEDLERAAIS